MRNAVLSNEIKRVALMRSKVKAAMVLSKKLSGRRAVGLGGLKRFWRECKEVELILRKAARDR